MLIIDLVARLFWFPFKPFRRYLPPSPPSPAPGFKPAPPRTQPNSPPANKPDSLVVTIKPSKMYIYTGKLNWDGDSAQAKDETFIIILPNGHVSKDDVAYVFFQWTKNDYGQENVNWFQTFPIENFRKIGSNGNTDNFQLNHHKYNWNVFALDGYNTLEVGMQGPGFKKNPVKITLERVWNSESHGGKAKDIPLVWTGKVNYQESAKNEMAMFVVPEGFGAGRPVVALWQWYRFNLPKNDPNIICYEPTDKSPPRVSFVQYGTQNIEHESEESVQFNFKHDYEVFASWSQGSGKLALRLKEPDSKTPQNLGELSLSGRFDRKSFGFHPPESKPEHLKLDVRLPQPQPSLPRITGKMPFPETLTETLAHTAAFVDQAGYLAKYAEEQFNALNAKYSLRGQQLDAVKAKNAGLEKAIDQTRAELQAERMSLMELEKLLTAAQQARTAMEAAFNKKIEEILKENAKNKDHEDKDHQIIKKLQDQIASERDKLNDRINKLQQDLNKSKAELINTKSLLLTALNEVRSLKRTISQLEGKLEASNSDRDGLRTKVRVLEANKKKTEISLGDAERALAVAKSQLENERKQHAKELADQKAAADKAADKAAEAAEAAAKAKAEAEAEIQKLRAQIQEDDDFHEQDKKFVEDDEQRKINLRRQYDELTKQLDAPAPVRPVWKGRH